MLSIGSDRLADLPVVRVPAVVPSIGRTELLGVHVSPGLNGHVKNIAGGS
jgi:hypothetical protein